MYVYLLSYTENPEKVIEFAARVSYQSFGKMTDDSHVALIKHLIKSGHMSVLEHAYASFQIYNVSRSLSHQLVRHRLASFTQRSQRYVNETSFKYVIPASIENNNEAKEIYQDTIRIIKDAYGKLLDMGIKKEDARFLLPNATTTDLIMTANFREWLHIISLRVSKVAQWEIRYLVTLIWKELYQIAPVIFDIESFSRDNDFEYKKKIFQSNIINNNEFYEE